MILDVGFDVEGLGLRVRVWDYPGVGQQSDVLQGLAVLEP